MANMSAGLEYKSVKEADAVASLSKCFNILNNIRFEDVSNKEKQKQIDELLRTTGDLITNIQASKEVKQG
jgi:heterodisulfide reductase subunit B